MIEPRRSLGFLGLAYLLVVALLVTFCVQVYRKAMPWQHAASVTLVTAAPGLELNPHSDVRLQGTRVGEVREVTTNGRMAVVRLALDPDKLHFVPRDVDAAIIPKTLFGEKYVDLRTGQSSPRQPIADGDVIRQSTTSVELGAIFSKLEPILRGLRPDQLSTALRSLATGLDGRGATLGDALVSLEQALRTLQPSLGTLVEDIRLTSDVADIYAAAAPDIGQIFDASAGLSSDLLVPKERELKRLLEQVIDTSGLTREVLAENSERIVSLTGRAQPVLEMLREFSATLPCFIRGLRLAEYLGNHSIGVRGPFLNLTIDAIASNEPYRYPDDLPTNPDSDAHDDNLPPQVPNWKPHCPVFRAEVYDLDNPAPFSRYEPGQTFSHMSATTPSSSNSVAPTAVAEARRKLARTTAAHLTGDDADETPGYAGLLLEPLLKDAVQLP